MDAFILVIFLLVIVNLLLSVSMALVLIKMFEIVKNQEERYQFESEAKRQARGLIDVDTSQIPYSLRK